ncbi:cilia- and flagella-associated protein 141-like [Saccostrea echinata]|uniref:cilia- and flagella-associated protein 141-like n=1 Tax=Saccostrea echinata TaxID=191078 RepID=UPI002A813602|nr:cilia- and flagella-associated protein 141-like [Saccostrea echinata]
MSMSTTLRFELNTGNNMKEAFLKQQERIQKDEMMAGRENIVRLEKNTNLRAEWNENLEKVSWNKRIQDENKRIQDEVRLAAKAAIAVRRKALQQLIQKEMDMYEQELSLQGKTFFKQRI